MKKVFLMLFLFASMAISASMFSAPAFAADAKSHSGHQCTPGEMECGKCQKECEKTLEYFKKKGGKYVEAKNLNILKDCIQTCKTSAEFQGRDSANSTKAMALCAEICRQCAKMCKDLNDPQLASCIKACESCAECCETK
jgi:hypothetical protein